MLHLVCGVDGNTYGNPCLAECKGVELAKNCECEEECESLLETEEPDYDPELPQPTPSQVIN